MRQQTGLFRLPIALFEVKECPLGFIKREEGLEHKKLERNVFRVERASGALKQDFCRVKQPFLGLAEAPA